MEWRLLTGSSESTSWCERLGSGYDEGARAQFINLQLPLVLALPDGNVQAKATRHHQRRSARSSVMKKARQRKLLPGTGVNGPTVLARTISTPRECRLGSAASTSPFVRLPSSD